MLDGRAEVGRIGVWDKYCATSYRLAVNPTFLGAFPTPLFYHSQPLVSFRERGGFRNSVERRSSVAKRRPYQMQGGLGTGEK